MQNVQRSIAVDILQIFLQNWVEFMAFKHFKLWYSDYKFSWYHLRLKFFQFIFKTNLCSILLWLKVRFFFLDPSKEIQHYISRYYQRQFGTITLPNVPFCLQYLDSTLLTNQINHCKVVSSRQVYYLILDTFGQRSQYISIKFPLHKWSENRWMCY